MFTIDKNLKYIGYEILKNALKPIWAQKYLRIKVCSVLFLPVLLYGSEIWTFR
jgi:hypothetical protein